MSMKGTINKAPLASAKTMRHVALAAALCMTGFAPLAQAADGEGWDWMVAPYGWLINVRTDLETNSPPSSASSDSAFDDIVDKIDGVFQLHVEGQGDRFGMFGDYTFLGLSDSTDRTVFNTDTDFEAQLIELAAVWSPGAERNTGIELFAGLRYIDVDVELQLEPVNPSFPTVTVDGGNSFADVMIGARYHWPLTQRFGLTLRGDGSFGDTDGTFNAAATFNYNMKHGAWLFGYRYLSASFEDNSNDTELELYGPQIGYGFKF